MKKFLVISLVFFVFPLIALGQDKPEPKGSWKVEREYDDAGNLIRYDSSYSYNGEIRFTMRDLDSLMGRINWPFSDSSLAWPNGSWGDFEKRFDQLQEKMFRQFEGMDELFHDLDSIEKRFELKMEDAIKQWEKKQKPKDDSEDKGVRI